MRKRLAVGIASVGLLAGLACVEGDPEGPEELETSGLNLTVDYKGGSDVAGFRYYISKCGKKSEPLKVVEKDLEDLVLPGGIPSFVNKPFDEKSQHLFADYFTVLKAGCYDVRAEPIDKYGDVSKQCRSVEYKGAIVKDGKTTEILLVSQCQGKKVGAIDVVAALNHPPKIKSLEYDPSKFLSCPDAQVKLCATAYDPDKDPMTFEWEQIKGPDVWKGPKVVYSKQKKGVRTECVTYKLEDLDADYKFKVTVYDQFHSKKGLITAEEWFYKNGYGKVESRASLKFPLYVACDKRDTCPRTMGFWKNHLDLWPESATKNVLYKVHHHKVTWLGVLLQPPLGSPCRILGRQYVPAMLNMMASAYTPQKILEAMEEAEGLFEQCPFLNYKQAKRAEEVKDILEKYNEGKYATEKCVDLKDDDNDEPATAL